MAAVAAAVFALASCSVLSPYHPPQPSPSVSAQSPKPGSQAGKRVWIRVGKGRVCVSGCRLLGVAFAKPTDLAPYLSATGVRPQIVQIYQGFGSVFPSAWAAATSAHHRLPMIQINPYKASLNGIAAGQYDGYLSSYAAALKAFGHPVALSFGHEQNGTWYPWGCRHTSAAVFIAAYRHMVTAIRNAGARNVVWVWTANVEAGGDCPIAARYPGDQYVTWVGLDGYMRKVGRTFTGIFGQTLAQIHKFTRKPILLAETGVLIGVQGDASRIKGLYSGAASAAGVIGVVYFDAKTSKFGDYMPQDSPAALAAYKQATAAYRASH
jgi:glycosyl hydrolase family 26